MMAAGEEVAEFVSEQNGEESDGEGQAGEERGGMFVEELESADEFVGVDGFIVRIGDGELSSGGETGAESEGEEKYGKGERLF